MKKILIIMAVIILTGCGGSEFSKKGGAASDTLTFNPPVTLPETEYYLNEAFGFEFYHPTGMKVENRGVGAALKTAEGREIVFIIKDNPGALSLQDFYSTGKEQKIYVEAESHEVLTIDGLRGRRFFNVGGEELIAVPVRGDMMEIRATAEDKAVLDQLATTLRF